MQKTLNLALRFALVCAALTTAQYAHADWYKDQQNIMGTVIRVELYHDDSSVARASINAVMEEMRRIDRLMSPYKADSELSQLNAHAAERAVQVSAELFELIKTSIHYSGITDGAFDITFASAGQLYDYRKGIRPSAKQLQQAIKKIDYHYLQLNERQKSIKYAQEGVRIDLGGIAKGYAVDNGIAILKRKGIRHAIITAGGDSRIIGDRKGRPWMIGIRDPRKSGSVKGTIPLIDSALSTSGDYERYFVRNGEHFHHILLPKTGTSAKALRSVTILGPDATTTDALSTSVFVLGPEKGMALVEKLAGIEAILIDQHDTMIYSSGLLTREPSE